MNDEFGPDDHLRPDPGGVPSEWSPPASSLPPPPGASSFPASPPGMAASDDTAVVATGPIMAERSPRAGWLGRGVALGAAAVLVGGGGYLAINAGSAVGGADSPRAALDGALAALSDEDLVGAAEFVEPTERETMVDAGFEVVQELTRLEVFDDSLDLESIEGIDLQFDDVEIRVAEVRPGLAHLFVESGTATSSVDGEAVPFGPLITDRVDEDDLAIVEEASTEMDASTTPIVAVERDGRWYLSLWYTVAENARIAVGEPLPDEADRIAEVGADTPEAAVEGFVDAIEQLDIATMIGMLDPLEAAALYDYGPLFVAEGQRAADDFLDEMRQEQWSWEVTALDLRAETDGDQATVFVDRIAVTANNDETSFDAVFSSEETEVSLESSEVDFEMIVAGDCVTMTIDEGSGPETDEMCADDILEEAGLEDLGAGALGQLSTVEGIGIVTHEVEGRWYISPIRTGSELTLTSLRAIDAEGLAETVDAFADMFSDPYFFVDSAFGGETFVEVDDFDFDFDDFDDLDEPGDFDDLLPSPSTTFVEVEDYPPYTDANAGLLAEGPEYVFVYDLVDVYGEDVWWQWLTDVEERDFETGVVGQAFLPGDHYVDVIVLTGVGVASDQELVDWLGGELVTDEGFTYLSTTNSWGEALLVARSGDGVAVVASMDGVVDGVVATLRNQVGA